MKGCVYGVVKDPIGNEMEIGKDDTMGLGSYCSYLFFFRLLSTWNIYIFIIV